MKSSFSRFIPSLVCCMIIALVVITGCTYLSIPGLPKSGSSQSEAPVGSLSGDAIPANYTTFPPSNAVPGSDARSSQNGPGSQTCDAAVNFQTDSKNCGVCGAECPPNSHCAGGQCPCDTGYGVSSNGRQCVLMSSGPHSASSPDTSSPTGTCDASTNFLTDNKNCGQCGGECPDHSSCDNGLCLCDTGYEVSSNQCVLAQSNVNAPTTTPTPSPSPTIYGLPPTCKIDSDCFVNAAASAAQLLHQYNLQLICNSGKCVALCDSGFTNCGTKDFPKCINVSSDSQNCGGCNIPCTGTCTGGACISLAQKVAIRPVLYLRTCSSGLTNCGTDASPICVNLSSDSQNCGQCNIPCPNGQVCKNKACQTPILIYVPPKFSGNIQP